MVSFSFDILLDSLRNNKKYLKLYIYDKILRRFEIIDRDAFLLEIYPNGNYDDVVLPKRGYY